MWTVLILVSILLGEKARKKESISVCRGCSSELHLLPSVTGPSAIPLLTITKQALLQAPSVVTMNQVRCKQKGTHRQY